MTTSILISFKKPQKYCGDKTAAFGMFSPEKKAANSKRNLNSSPSTVQCMLAVCLSGKTLASINVVALRQTRLVPGWVTVCGRVNHLGMQSAS